MVRVRGYMFVNSHELFVPVRVRVSNVVSSVCKQ